MAFWWRRRWDFENRCWPVALSALLRDFVVPRNLGLVTGADGMIRLFPGLIRLRTWPSSPGTAFLEDGCPKSRYLRSLQNWQSRFSARATPRPRWIENASEYFEVGRRRRLAGRPQDRERSRSIDNGTGLARDLRRRLKRSRVSFPAGFRLVLADLFAELDRDAGHRLEKNRSHR